jgi:CBS domain-containing protein
MEEQREEDILRVEDAMQPAEDPVLDAERTLDDAVKMLDHSEIDDLLVRLSPAGWGSVSKGQLLAMAGEGKGATTLGSLLPITPVPYLHPDHPLETALRYVNRWPVVPVVSRADFGKLEGIVTQRHVLERYREFGEG